MSQVQVRHRLVRVPGGLLAGVAEGIGRYAGVNPWWIRLAWVVMVLAFGTGLLLYGLLWWLMPKEDAVPVESTVWVRDANGHHPPLARTTTDRKVLGVCGGLARRFGWEPTLVRLAVLALFAGSAGVAIVAYAAAALLMPSPDMPRPAPHPVEL
jgi:phage shock protein C